MTFDPRYAIVTASDSGIGKAAAVALAQAGMDVGVTWHSDSEGADATAEEVRSHGRKAVVKQLDYTDLPSCAVTVDLLIDELGGLDVFVNNVGTGVRRCSSTPPMTSGGRSSPTATDGTFVCMRQAAKHMVKQATVQPVIADHQRSRAPATRWIRRLRRRQARHRRIDQDLRPGAGSAPDPANAVAPGEIATPMTGQEDQDPHQRSGSAYTRSTRRRPGSRGRDRLSRESGRRLRHRSVLGGRRWHAPDGSASRLASDQ